MRQPAEDASFKLHASNPAAVPPGWRRRPRTQGPRRASAASGPAVGTGGPARAGGAIRGRGWTSRCGLPRPDP